MRENSITLPDGRKISYAEYGQSNGEVVFMFHGTPGSRFDIYATWLESIAKEGQRPLRIIVPERPGYELSDAKAERTLKDWCQDMESLTQEPYIDQFSTVGTSGGGPYALACACHMPNRIRKVAVICGIGPISVLGQEGLFAEEKICLQGTESTRAYLGQLTNMAEADPDRSVAYYFSNLPETDKQLISSDLVPVFKRLVIDVTRQAEGIIHDYVIYGRPWNLPLREIRIPIAFWHSEADNVVPIHHAEYQIDSYENGTPIGVPFFDSQF